MDLLIIILFFVALIKESIDNAGKKKPRQTYRPSSNSDQESMNALFVLMAAEDGVFVPGAEHVFNRRESNDQGYQSDSVYESQYDQTDHSFYEQDEYYDDDFPPDEGEIADHWGPV